MSLLDLIESDSLHCHGMFAGVARDIAAVAKQRAAAAPKDGKNIASATMFAFDKLLRKHLVRSGQTAPVDAAWGGASALVNAVKDTFDAPLVSLVCADLKLSGAPQLIAVGVDGEVRGYLPAVVERDTSKAEDDLRRKREIEQLQAEKRRLVGELRALEEQPQTPSDDAQGIPPDTQISLDVAAPVHGGGFELVVATSNQTYVVGVVVLDTDGGLFEGETLSCAPARPSDKLGIVVRPKKNFPASLKLQIHVAARPSSSAARLTWARVVGPSAARGSHGSGELAPPTNKRFHSVNVHVSF